HWREAFSSFSQRGRDSKTRLQEWAQGQKRALPAYDLVERTGLDHAPTFVVRVQVEGIEPASASGRSRQEAEKAAAQALLDREGVK
ncbi:MAG: ribonuclease, partial [Caulobacteraceae bacterium]|nr:ribonuclease [Caulobacteraceae bacterium]